MHTMLKARIVGRLASFAAVALLAFFLLVLFPFYPLYIAIGLALVLGIVAIELPGLGLLLAVLLSVLAAAYQSPFIGLTVLVVLVLLSSAIAGGFDIAMIVAGWMLGFFLTPSLAILPAVLAGYHDRREDALKVGAVSGISIFLLSWVRGIAQAGFMFAPSPNNYRPKSIPDPWQFQAFMPSGDVLNNVKVGTFFAPLISSIGDFRIYALILGWAIAGFLIALLVQKWKGYLSMAASVVGILPLVALSFVFAQTPPLDIGFAVVGTIVVAFGYRSLQPLVSAPTLPTFTSLSGLVTTGIPQKYTLLLGSPACDERNLVVEKFIESGLDKKIPSFMVTSDASFAESAAKKFGDMLMVLVVNPRAAAGEKNVIPLTTGVQNLTSLNIELVKLVKDRAGSSARVILDVVSEVMLAHKMLTTRKWVSDLIPRFENWGFTVLGVFNPSLHSNEEVQGLIELFNGYVQIYEKDYLGKTRKLIAVRKMADLQYNEAELVIDKEQLARKKSGRSGLRQRLGK